MLKRCVIVLIAVVLVSSCKKKESTPSQPNNSQSATTPANQYSVTIPAGLNLATGGHYCNLATFYQIYDNSGTIELDSNAYAFFYAGPSNPYVTPTLVSAGNVYYGPYQMQYSPPNYELFGVPVHSTITWSVAGSGTVTAFTQSFVPSYPVYNGANTLPDTCVKANGFTVTINALTNCGTPPTVYLQSMAASMYKTLPGDNGSVAFSAAELSNFNINQPFTISISFINFFEAMLNGYKRGFSNTLSYRKNCYMK